MKSLNGLPTQPTMKKNIFLSLTISLLLLLSSCSNELDYSESWIEIYQYDDHSMSNGNMIKNDTIYMSFTTLDEPLILQVRTQSNDGSTPRFYKQIDNQERVEITEEVPVSALYTNPDGGYRQINEIDVFVSSNLFTSGQMITLETTIGSVSGTLSKEMYVVIE